MSWKDVIITPAVSFGICLVAFLCTWAFHDRYKPDLFASALIFYVSMTAWTLLVLKILRTLFPIKDGVYSLTRNADIYYLYNLYSFLCITNLCLLFVNGLLPPFFRQFFYRMLGVKTGNGIVFIGGRLWEPHRITIEEGAMIGDEAMLIPHAHIVTSENTLILGRIEIKKGAMIGARSVLMPGVSVGENSMVNAMSLVPMNTKIPPYEIWGGNPAKKIGEIKAPGKMGSAESMKETEEALRD